LTSALATSVFSSDIFAEALLLGAQGGVVVQPVLDDTLTNSNQVKTSLFQHRQSSKLASSYGVRHSLINTIRLGRVVSRGNFLALCHFGSSFIICRSSQMHQGYVSLCWHPNNVHSAVWGRSLSLCYGPPNDHRRP
jgi:hypothetical protein